MYHEGDNKASKKRIKEEIICSLAAGQKCLLKDSAYLPLQCCQMAAAHRIPSIAKTLECLLSFGESRGFYQYKISTYFSLGVVLVQRTL
jgi:hypothetical protein